MRGWSKLRRCGRFGTALEGCSSFTPHQLDERKNKDWRRLHENEPFVADSRKRSGLNQHGPRLACQRQICLLHCGGRHHQLEKVLHLTLMQSKARSCRFLVGALSPQKKCLVFFLRKGFHNVIQYRNCFCSDAYCNMKRHNFLALPVKLHAGNLEGAANGCYCTARKDTCTTFT